jgi:hypothetical protein
MLSGHVFGSSNTFGMTINISGAGISQTQYEAAIVTAQNFDILLLFDSTGSFSTELGDLSNNFPSVLQSISDRFGNISSLGFGVARFEDYNAPQHPGGGSGDPNDRPFILNQPIITQQSAGASFADALKNAVARLNPGAGGGDDPEAPIEAIYQAATGAGFNGNQGQPGDTGSGDSGTAGSVAAQQPDGVSGDVPTYSSLNVTNLGLGTLPPAASLQNGQYGLGGAGFRPGAVPIIFVLTDNETAYQPEDAPVFKKTGGAAPKQMIAGVNGTLVPFVHDANNPVGFTAPGSRNDGPSGPGARIQQTIDALVNLGAIVVGIGPNGVSGTQAPLLQAIAKATGSVNATSRTIGGLAPGDPLYFNFDTSDPATSFSNAINTTMTVAAESINGSTPLPQFDPTRKTGSSIPYGSISTGGIITLSNVAPNAVNTDPLFTGSNPPINAQTFFQSARVGTNGSIDYRLAVGSGTRTVNLYFAEINSSFGVGDRVFNVSAEGTPVSGLQNFDIRATAGSSNGSINAIEKTFQITVGTDGILDLDFTRVSGAMPLLSGIEII